MAHAATALQRPPWCAWETLLWHPPRKSASSSLVIWVYSFIDLYTTFQLWNDTNYDKTMDIAHTSHNMWHNSVLMYTLRGLLLSYGKCNLTTVSAIPQIYHTVLPYNWRQRLATLYWLPWPGPTILVKHQTAYNSRTATCKNGSSKYGNG